MDFYPNIKLVIVGEGHMKHQLIERAIELNMEDKIIFTGWLKGDEVHKAFQIADLFVMPSVAEPFGLVALESLMNNTPVLIISTEKFSN